jgi:hypothetical protein
MALKTDITRLPLDQVGLIRTMYAVAALAVSFRKRRVGIIFQFCHRQVFMAGKTKLLRHHSIGQQPRLYATMRIMAGYTIATGKWPVLTEQPLL